MKLPGFRLEKSPKGGVQLEAILGSIRFVVRVGKFFCPPGQSRTDSTSPGAAVTVGAVKAVKEKGWSTAPFWFWWLWLFLLVVSSTIPTVDATGRRTSVTDWDLVSGTNRVRRTAQYSYDQDIERASLTPKLYRLAHEDITSAVVTNQAGTVSHQFDRRSNRNDLQSSVSWVANFTADFSLRDELTSLSGSAQYWDANGNLTGGAGFTNYWDAENRLLRRVIY